MTIIDYISKINSEAGKLVWGTPMLILLISIGLYFTIKLKLFQFLKIKEIWLNTIGSLFSKKTSKSKKGISQFQALSTALAATIGTGSIAGVATAITIGGAGAVFWMWVSAVVGMMTIFAENVLGIFYRQHDEKDGWKGGAMYYIEHGLSSKWLAVLFAILCVLASFGMGNMVQSNSISDSLSVTYLLSPKITGIIMATLSGIVILGGIKRIGKFSEKLIPFISIIYIIGCLIVILSNVKVLPNIFEQIFEEALGLKAISGGITGEIVRRAISIGLKRGVFSNEAGLGSSVAVSSASDVKEPVVAGMWGIIEVFIDTIIVCTLTALVILSSGVIETGNTLDGSALVISAFEKVMGGFSSHLVTFFIVVFAFATIIGWEFIGEKASQYIFGEKSIFAYRIMFVVFVYIGAIIELRLAWDISDTLNGMMAIPNLIALALLSKTVIRITKNYNDRKHKGKKIKPMLSAFKNIQQEHEQDLY